MPNSPRAKKNRVGHNQFFNTAHHACDGRGVRSRAANWPASPANLAFSLRTTFRLSTPVFSWTMSRRLGARHLFRMTAIWTVDFAQPAGGARHRCWPEGSVARAGEIGTMLRGWADGLRLLVRVGTAFADSYLSWGRLHSGSLPARGKLSRNNGDHTAPPRKGPPWKEQ
jgi:hypothetical protein